VLFYSYLIFVYRFDKYVEKRIDKFYWEVYQSDPTQGDSIDQFDRIQMKRYQPSYSKLIELIKSEPKEILQEISPSFKNLQVIINLPMLFMALGCGGLTATTGAFFKLAGELIKSNSQEYNSFADWMVYLFIFLAVMNSVIQITYLQILMKKYNQMQSMSIYYGSMTLLEIYCGLYLLDES